MIAVKSLEKTPLKIIYMAFKSAFSDYMEPFDASQKQFDHMLQRRGYTPQFSFGVFVGETLVGFTLNAIGPWHNKLTAYDTGTGTVVGFRQQGMAQKIFDTMIPELRCHGVSQYLLEVIKTNSAAFNLYKKAGFQITREFNYYITDKKDLKFRERKVTDITYNEIKKPDWEHLCSFWDFEPSWQNSIDSINRKKKKIKLIGIYKSGLLAGYGAVECHSGDIMQLAVAKKYRGIGLATLLLKHLVSQVEINGITIINTLAGHRPFNKFAQSIGLYPGPGQYEMQLNL